MDKLCCNIKIAQQLSELQFNLKLDCRVSNSPYILIAFPNIILCCGLPLLIAFFCCSHDFLIDGSTSIFSLHYLSLSLANCPIHRTMSKSTIILIVYFEERKIQSQTATQWTQLYMCVCAVVVHSSPGPSYCFTYIFVLKSPEATQHHRTYMYTLRWLHRGSSRPKR